MVDNGWFDSDDAEDVPACDVCRIMCFIKSSWFLETTPHSRHGNSESKNFLCGCVNVYCCATGCTVALVCALLVCGNCTWYWCSVVGVKGGKRIWWEWNKCWRSVSVFMKISLHDEHEYWICGIIVVTVCGADWIEMWEDAGGDWDVWWTVDDNDGNGWSKRKEVCNFRLNFLQFLTYLNGFELAESCAAGYQPWWYVVASGPIHPIASQLTSKPFHCRSVV